MTTSQAHNVGFKNPLLKKYPLTVENPHYSFIRREITGMYLPKMLNNDF